MAAEPPDAAQVWKAVELYLAAAYENEPPIAVRSTLSTLRSWAGKLYTCPVFVKDSATNPTKISVRLGNRFYPHMKMVIEQTPAGDRFLFKADTHDRHCCPPEGAPEHTQFAELMSRNLGIAQAIEASWAEHDIPTFKTWLRDDLAKRREEEGTEARGEGTKA